MQLQGEDTKKWMVRPLLATLTLFPTANITRYQESDPVHLLIEKT